MDLFHWAGRASLWYFSNVSHLTMCCTALKAAACLPLNLRRKVGTLEQWNGHAFKEVEESKAYEMKSRLVACFM